jgi:hypothetical protein
MTVRRTVQGRSELQYTPSFLEFIKLFAVMDEERKLFPKECRTCGRTFHDYSHYVHETTPKGHTMEDCQETMGIPFTMIYRHCYCGNTLVLTLKRENFSALERFWVMLKKHAESTGEDLKVVVAEFSAQCDHYITNNQGNSQGAGS